MPFPAGLTLVTVHGRIDALPTGGASGQVRFDRAYALVGGADNSIVPPRPEYATLDAAGEFTITLPATNDPDWTPVGWAYQVEVNTSAGLIRGSLQLDYLVTAVELADLLQVDGTAVPGTTYIALSARGAALGVAALDVDGDVNDAAGNKITGGGGGGGGTPSGSVVSETAYGQSASAGNVTAYSRGNHTHGTPALPTAADVGAEPAGVVAAHVALPDPHTQYALAAANTIALNLKAPLASPTFTGTVAGITKAMVGLGSVDNTADTAKPVSTAQLTALNLKADLASPALTGTPTAPTQTALNNSTRLATTAYVEAAVAAGGGGGTAATFARGYVTSGDVTPGLTAAWTPVSGLAFSLAAVAGDEVEFTMNGLLSQTATAFFDLAVLVSGSIVRYASTGTASPTAAGEGDGAIYPLNASTLRPLSAYFSLAVASGDLTGGTVTFALIYKGDALGKVYASANYPLRWRIRNDH